MKRIFDFVSAILLLILLLPVWSTIILLIKLSSQGSVLFKQKRVGLNRSEFGIYKFRSMYIDTPKDTPTHLLENPEQYITPIGRFLRKTSLDELPQLVNIIKGEMSFVGPRPALYNQYDLISLREQYGINYVRPGLTGWAQVNGRDELPIPIKVEYDRYYVENMSIWFDLKILFMTTFNVILSKGVVEGKRQEVPPQDKIEIKM